MSKDSKTFFNLFLIGVLSTTLGVSVNYFTRKIGLGIQDEFGLVPLDKFSSAQTSPNDNRIIQEQARRNYAASKKRLEVLITDCLANPEITNKSSDVYQTYLIFLGKYSTLTNNFYISNKNSVK